MELPRARRSERPQNDLPTLESLSKPLVLVADSKVMRQLSDLSSTLLQQYDIDVSRKGHAGACAQFYLESLQALRRDFWLSMLMNRRQEPEGRRRPSYVGTGTANVAGFT